MTAPPLRVLHVMTAPESLGFLRGQAAFMRERGIELLAVAGPGPEGERFAQAEQVPVYEIPLHRRIAPIADLRAVLALVRLIRRLGPDIVHAHTPKAGLVGMIAARLAGIRVRIYHLRGLPLETATGPLRWTLWCSERVACGVATRVLAVSPSLREAVIAWRLVPSWKIQVPASGSGNGVDAVGRFAPGPDDAVIRERWRAEHEIPRDAVLSLFLGRLSQDKGIDLLTHTWRSLEDEPVAYLVIVGPLDQRSPVAAEHLTYLRAHPRVRFVGASADTRPWYAAADLVVFPSRREGFPNVPLEAAAMGLPVVTTDATGCRDAVLDGVTGAVVPLGDATRFAAAVRDYILEPSRRRRQGEAGRTRVLDRFAPQRLWVEYLAVYRQHLAPRPENERSS